MWRGWTSNDIDLNIAYDGNYSHQNDNDNDNQRKITRWMELAITVTMAKVIHWPLAIIDQVTLLTLCDWVREWQWTALKRASAQLWKYACIVVGLARNTSRRTPHCHLSSCLMKSRCVQPSCLIQTFQAHTCWCNCVYVNTDPSLWLHILEHINKDGP